MHLTWNKSNMEIRLKYRNYYMGNKESPFLYWDESTRLTCKQGSRSGHSKIARIGDYWLLCSMSKNSTKSLALDFFFKYFFKKTVNKSLQNGNCSNPVQCLIWPFALFPDFWIKSQIVQWITSQFSARGCCFFHHRWKVMMILAAGRTLSSNLETFQHILYKNFF